MKYKLLKDLPEVGNGSIFEQHKSLYNYFAAECSNLSYSKEFIDSNPSWFAPYKFTTEDGVDIFEGDNYLSVNKRGVVWEDANRDIWISGDKDKKYFSTKEAAQKYIDSQKPRFEEYKWYNRNGCDSMYVGDGKGVGFVGRGDRWRDDFKMTDRSQWEESDLNKVKELLIHKVKEDYSK